MDRDANYRVTAYAKFLRNRDECIAECAHHCWELRGCPEGSPGKDWFQAEDEFDQIFLAQVDLMIPA